MRSCASLRSARPRPHRCTASQTRRTVVPTSAAASAPASAHSTQRPRWCVWLPDRPVAGGHCTLCVTYLGEMLAFGRNDFGQLGLGALAIL